MEAGDLLRQPRMEEAKKEEKKERRRRRRRRKKEEKINEKEIFIEINLEYDEITKSL